MLHLRTRSEKSMETVVIPLNFPLIDIQLCLLAWGASELYSVHIMR